MSLVGVRDIIGTTRENSSIYEKIDIVHTHHRSKIDGILQSFWVVVILIVIHLVFCKCRRNKMEKQ